MLQDPCLCFLYSLAGCIIRTGTSTKCISKFIFSSFQANYKKIIYYQSGWRQKAQFLMYSINSCVAFHDMIVAFFQQGQNGFWDGKIDVVC